MRKITPSIGLFFAGSLFLSTVAWTQQESEDKNYVPPSPASPESAVSHEQKPQEPAALSQKAPDANATKPTPESQAQRAGEPSQATIPLATAKPTQQQTLVSSKALVGATVKNLQGEKLGDLQELMIDPQTGRVVYATLASGTVLGMGGKPLDIPWEALKVDLGKDGLIVEVDNNKLQAGSSYDMSQR
jgi:sporulation protein YlmC with PRC-barrel domain